MTTGVALGPYVRELWSRREFAMYLAVSRLEARHRFTTLGVFWFLLNPLLLGAVYFIVFGTIFDNRSPEFLAYLLSGLFVFHYTQRSVVGGVGSVISNRTLMLNLAFPRLILPIAGVTEAAAGFLASLLVLVGVSFLMVTPDLLVMLLIVPLAFVLQTIFNLGLSALTARMAVPVRDLSNLIPFAMRIWLYLSPILWPLSFLENAGETVQLLAQANPMFAFISLYRGAFLGSPIEAWQIWYAVGVSLLLGLVGILTFLRAEKGFVRYI